MGKYVIEFEYRTPQMIIKDLINNHHEVLEIFKVSASDRKYQIWERNPLSISLWTQLVFKQKRDYLQLNPVVAGICKSLEEYKCSSTFFVLKQILNGLF